MSAPAAVVRAIAGSRPAGVVGNDALASRLDTSDEWIRTRTGIGARHWAGPATATSDLAMTAGAAAIALAPGPIDTVLVATTTPDHGCPATAPAVAAGLGLGEAAAFDIGAACSGFVYGLAAAAGLLLAGVSTRVLLVAAETLSRLVDLTDRHTAILFGDGAGAVVLERGDAADPGALLSYDLGSDGHGLSLLLAPAGGSRRPLDAEGLRAGEHLLRMDGKAVYREAVGRMSASASRCADAAAIALPDVARVVAHQANARIVDAVMDRLALPRERAFHNIARYGNTSAASIPLALSDLASERPPEPGAPVLLTAFGAGFTWASAVLRWPDPDRIGPVLRHDEKETHPWTTCSTR